MQTSKKISIDEYMKKNNRLAPNAATQDSYNEDGTVDQLEIKKELDLEIYN